MQPVIPMPPPPHRRRGRPKAGRPHSDSGTPELVMKRLLGETTEALDLCMERGIITPEQHWCGVHLRWLYTLRHGAPGVRAVDPRNLGGMDTKLDDPEWRAAREQEFHEALQKLHLRNSAAIVLNLCIHNERPAFLNIRRPILLAPDDSLYRIQQALDILVELWGRHTRKKH